MKVYNLCCEREHRFEGWFASEDDFMSQAERHMIECPICNSISVKQEGIEALAFPLPSILKQALQ